MEKFMKALTQKPDSDLLSFADIPIPLPESGQVLIKVHVTAIHAMDMDLLRRASPNRYTSPIPGIEGSGIIVQGKKSVFSRSDKGKKVSFIQLESALPGSWAEYVVCDEKHFMVLNEDIDFLRGSTLMLNPLTVLMMHEKVKAKKHKNIIHTNAASDLGIIFIKWCHFNGLNLISIVSKLEDLPKLKAVAAENVLCEESPEFSEKFKEICSNLKPTCAFDSLGGKLAGEIFGLLQENGEMFLYGSSESEFIEGISPSDFIFAQKTLKGLKFKEWFCDLSAIKRFKYFKKIQKIHFVFNSVVANVYPISQYEEALKAYSSLGTTLLHFACNLQTSSKSANEDILSHYISNPLNLRIKSLEPGLFELPDYPVKVIAEGIYKGELENDRPHGKGILFSNNTYYIGHFADGMKSGHGRYITEEYWYEGEFRVNFYEGPGKLIMFNGHTIEGHFIKGYLQGPGVETFSHGEVYTGNFLNSLRDGQGEIKYESIKFTGEFKSGIAEGNGKCELDDGSVFEGIYHKGIGTGVLKKPDGQSIEGSIAGNKFTEKNLDNPKKH